jgi:signal transduction histidine kinase
VTDHREEERRILELMEAKNRFLASVSHEIRTPLTALLGFARLLADGHELGENDRRLMTASIVQQAQEMADLVEDLLVAARVELGQIEVVNVPLDVVHEIRQTLDAGGTYAVGVNVKCGAKGREAIGDPSRVRQILRNLLTNAERYGGPEVVATVSCAEGEVYIDVIDDGPGLPTPEWERIFEPYHRAHESPGQPGSVGIGLAISRQLAELMGGGLEYHHRDGRSVFRLRLRAAGC